jgi:hypothetical protein
LGKLEGAIPQTRLFDREKAIASLSNMVFKAGGTLWSMIEVNEVPDSQQ